MRQPSLDAASLTRKTTGLSPAHRALIRLLAELAVNEYLREIESDEVVQNNDQPREEMT